MRWGTTDFLEQPTTESMETFVAVPIIDLGGRRVRRPYTDMPATRSVRRAWAFSCGAFQSPCATMIGPIVSWVPLHLPPWDQEDRRSSGQICGFGIPICSTCVVDDGSFSRSLCKGRRVRRPYTHDRYTANTGDVAGD